MFRFFQQSSKTIAGGAMVIGVLSLTSRAVGLVRDRIFASTFGTGDTLDVYYAAFRIPDTIFALLVMGALSASFIPIFAKYQVGGVLNRQGAWHFTNKVLHLIAGGYVVFAVLGIVFASPLASLVAPGFSDFKLDQVALFMRVMFLAQLFLAVSTVLGSVLQATKRFFLFSLAPVFYNLGIIFGALVLTHWLGAIGLAWGVVLGALFHALVSVFGVRDLGYRYHIPKRLWDEETREVLLMMGPRVLGLGVTQLQFLVLSILASTLAVGSVSAFQLAFNLQYVPIGIVAVSFAVAVFPTLSQSAHEGDHETFSETIATTARQILFLMIPATLLFLLLRAQIVRVVLGGGVFGWDETILVADTLAFFSLSFFAQALTHLLARGLFAKKDSLTPFLAGGVSLIVLVLGSLTFTKDYGVAGLAMAFSLASLVQVALLWLLLRLRAGSLHESKMISGLMKMTVAGMVMGVVIQLAKPLTLTFAPLDTFWGVFMQGAFAGGVGFIAYLGMSFALGSEELGWMRSAIDRKLFHRFQSEEALNEISAAQE